MAENKAKILFIVTKSEVGGAQKYVKEQMEICKDTAHVYLVTNKDGWLTGQVAPFAEAILCDNRIESRLSPGFINALSRFIKKHGIDLVVCNSANGGLYGRLAAFRCKIPSIYVSHGWSSVYNGGKLAFVLNKVEKWLANLGTKVLCVSDADYKVAREKIGIAPAKLVLLKNCIFPVGKQPALDYNGGKLKLLALARFAYPKRMDLLIDAVAGLDFVDLHIVGDGPGFSATETALKEKKITNVFLHGEIRSFDDFNNYHAFILISESEGLPMSALEAMSAGLPLVLSKVGGCVELVENKELLVDNTTGSIEKALAHLRADFSLYRNTARHLFDEKFNLLERAPFFLSLYYSLIKK